MKLLSLLASGLFCLSSTVAFANLGDEILNGGDVVLCSSRGVQRYDVLDLHEGAAIYGFQYSGISGRTFSEIVRDTLKRLEKFDSARALRLQENWLNFPVEVRFVNDAVFGNIEDEGWTSVPKGCELQQAAVQLGDKTPDGKKYLINNQIWRRLSNEGKAALVLHELIYREGRLPENDFKNARGVRYFNAFLHSTQFEFATVEEYNRAVVYAGFKN